MLHFARCRISVLRWRRCDTLCTSGFTEDVIFSHNDVWHHMRCGYAFDLTCVMCCTSKRQEDSWYNCIDSNQILLDAKAQVLIEGCTPEAKSASYDFPMYFREPWRHVAMTSSAGALLKGRTRVQRRGGSTSWRHCWTMTSLTSSTTADNTAIRYCLFSTKIIFFDYFAFDFFLSKLALRKLLKCNSDVQQWYALPTLYIEFFFKLLIHSEINRPTN